MKNRPVSEISESEESAEEQNLRQPSTSNVVTRDNDDSSPNSSSESEDAPPPPPPVNATERRSSTSKKNVSCNPLERFVQENKGLTKLDVVDVVSTEDDVCLLEVPKTIDPSEFLERIINFDRKTKIKINKTKYVIEPEVEEIKPINILARKLKIIHPISVLRMRQYSKSKRESGAVNEAINPPALPDKLKVRHPLFGSEFKRKIVLDEEIQKKLDITIDEVVKKIKKKKHKEEETCQEFVAPMEPTTVRKKKHKKRATESEYEQDENRQGNVDESIFALLETHIAEKSKKGHKNSKEDARASSSDSGIFGDIKSKCEHRENESADNENVQKKKCKTSVMEEESGNNDYKHKIKHNNNIAVDVSSEYEHKRKHNKSISKGGDDHEHLHQKKHKNSIKEIKDVTSEHDEENIKDVKPKHKKRKNSQGDLSSFSNHLVEERKSQNSVKQEASDSSDWESNAKIEKKKRYKTNISDLSQDTKSVVDNESFEKNTNKKKKKHHHIKEEKLSSGHEQESEEADESWKHKRKNSTKRDSTITEQEGSDDCVKTNTSEKKSRSSFINSTVIPGVQLPLFEFDVSSIVNKEEQEIHDSSKNDGENREKKKSHKDRRKKEASFEFDDKMEKKEKKVKKERTEQLEDYELNEEAISPRKRKKKAYSDEEETSSPKKKRKQIKQEVNDDEDDVQTNSLILNLLNKVKSEMDTSISYKKKK